MRAHVQTSRVKLQSEEKSELKGKGKINHVEFVDLARCLQTLNCRYFNMTSSLHY